MEWQQEKTGIPLTNFSSVTFLKAKTSPQKFQALVPLLLPHCFYCHT